MGTMPTRCPAARRSNAQAASPPVRQGRPSPRSLRQRSTHRSEGCGAEVAVGGSLAHRVGGDDGVGARHRERIGGRPEESVEDAGAGLGGTQQVGVGGRELSIAGRQAEDRVAVGEAGGRAERRGRARRGRTAPAGRPPVGSSAASVAITPIVVFIGGAGAPPGATVTAADHTARSAAVGRRRPGGGNHGSPVAASITEPDALTTASAATVIVCRSISTVIDAMPTPPCMPPARAPVPAPTTPRPLDDARGGRGASTRTRPSADCRTGRRARGRRSPPSGPPARRGPDRDRPARPGGAARGAP